jgi:hypothetical protein
MSSRIPELISVSVCLRGSATLKPGLFVVLVPVLFACGKGRSAKDTGSQTCEPVGASVAESFDPTGLWEVDLLLSTSTWDLDRGFAPERGVVGRLEWVAYNITAVTLFGGERPTYSVELFDIAQWLRPTRDPAADVLTFLYEDGEEFWGPSARGWRWSGVPGESTLVLLRSAAYTRGGTDEFEVVDASLWCRPFGAERMFCQWSPPADTLDDRPEDYWNPTGHQVLVRRPADWAPRPLSPAQGIETLLLTAEGLDLAVPGDDQCVEPGSTTTAVDCDGYVAALSPCLEAAGVELSAADVRDNQCASHADLPLRQFFDCAAEALSDADCSTGEGFGEARRAVRRCASAAAEPS